MDDAAQAADTSGSGSQYSVRMSVSSVAGISNEVEAEVGEAKPAAAADKVFVALGADVKHGKSTLQWALQNLAKDGTKIVIAHVHRPAQMVPMMGAKVHYTLINPQEVNDYRNKEREKAEEELDQYLLICRKLKNIYVSCEKLIIEEEDIAKGLEHLIALHGITKLVMGAAADKHYSRNMSTPRSMIALKILEAADPSCKIWFTCKGRLICTREGNTIIPAISSTPFLDKFETLRKAFSDIIRISGSVRRAAQQAMYEHVDNHFASPCELENSGDDAVSEAQDLRQKNKQRISSMPGKKQYTEFSSELKRAARHFSFELKIGVGAFGSVYKGTLRNTTVAIELLVGHSIEGQSKEFDEAIAYISRVRHPNLVRLIGVCQKPLALVYEFLPKGNLDDRLTSQKQPPLTWQERTKIIYEICSVLTFLHSTNPPIVHGDLQPANILFDANLVSKLSNLGIYRLFMLLNRTASIVIEQRGTYMYLDPEYYITGTLTPHSDVYSLGIIILQLLTGKNPGGVAVVVKEAIKRGELHSILDHSAENWPLVQAKKLAHLGLQCAEVSRRDRPGLASDVWKVVEPLMKAASPTAGRAPSFDVLPPPDFVYPVIKEVMNDPHTGSSSGGGSTAGTARRR